MNATEVPLPKALMSTTLSLSVLRSQMAKAKRADEDVHNLAKSLLKPGVEIIYKRGDNPFLARVVGVIGAPGRTRVTVERMTNKRREDIQLEEITGIVQS